MLTGLVLCLDPVASGRVPSRKRSAERERARARAPFSEKRREREVFIDNQPGARRRVYSKQKQ